MRSSRRDVLRWTLLGLAMPGAAAARAEPLLPRELTRPAPRGTQLFDRIHDRGPLYEVVVYLHRACGLPLSAELLESYDGGWTGHELALITREMHDHLRGVVTALQAGSKPDAAQEKLLGCCAEPGRLRAVLGWYRMLLDKSAPMLKLLSGEPETRAKELAGWISKVDALATLARPFAPTTADKPRSAFEDVPLAVEKEPRLVLHPAYTIVNELAAEGIFTGYPDGTFAGRRTLTRYEFAIAMQRMWAEMLQYQTQLTELVQREGAAPATPSREYETALGEVLFHRLHKGWIRALVSEFHTELLMLGADPERIEDNLSALDRLARTATVR